MAYSFVAEISCELPLDHILGRFVMVDRKVRNCLSNPDLRRNGAEKIEIGFVPVEGRFSLEFVGEDLEREKLRPLTLHEILTFGACHGDVVEEGVPVISLSPWRRPAGLNDYFPRIGRWRTGLYAWFSQYGFWPRSPISLAVARV